MASSDTTDGVAQVSTDVVGIAPAVAVGTLYQMVAQAVGNAAHDATSAQRAGDTLRQAVTAAGVAFVYAQAPKPGA